MMKSWISFLLPEDEYKEKKMLYFLSEGAIILLLSILVMAIFNKYANLSAGAVILLSIAIFLLYVLGRYIISGMEYTEVATDKSYKKEKRNIRIQAYFFFTAFLLLNIITSGRPEWVEIIGIVFTATIFWFINFVSLKRSYKKNRELL